MSKTKEALLADLEKLDLADQEWVINKLLKNKRHHLNFGPQLTKEELLKVEIWLFEHQKNARTAVQRLSRSRVCIIYLLARYGALRLTEIAALKVEDLLYTNKVITIKGKHDRKLYLPESVCHRIKDLLLQNSAYVLNTPCNFNRAALRHKFANCAKACGLLPGLLNVRNLRAHRSFELQQMGLPSYLLQAYLDAGSIDAPSMNLLADLCTRETTMLTSARNVFQGRVETVTSLGIMVEVRLKCSSGLQIMALITDTSRARLDIQPGKVVFATVKAPLVQLHKSEYVPPSFDPDNYYPGIVTATRNDTKYCEISVTLFDGSCVCALQRKETCEQACDTKVLVHIKPLTVVLHTNLG